uniref:TruB_N domain-containing protein n=1 Tax=Parastrongyloides trichosuri TaxID=131310 RepID=A0A0N4ZZ33_PARTI
MKLTLSASEIQKLLTGFCCIYKPKDTSIAALKKLICNKIVEDGNEFHNIKVPSIKKPIISYSETGVPLIIGYKNQLDYTKHPLVCGFPFRVEDIRLNEFNCLEPASSGVCLFGVNLSDNDISGIQEKNWVSEYKLNGQLGVESYKNLIRGKVVKTSQYSHINRGKINKLISRLLHFYKRSSFEHHNISLESEEAFELARQGLAKPSIPNAPIIYNLSLDAFKPPYFSITVQGVNLTDAFLREFIFHFGVHLDSIAAPKYLRCIRVGPFTTEEALLEKNINLKELLGNILICNDIVDKFNNTSKNVVTELDKNVDDIKKKYLIEIKDPFHDSMNHDQEVIDDLRIPWGRYYNKV